VDLYTEEAPTECTNFVKLCKAKYYTFAPFYNIRRDYLVEFGDPLYPLSTKGESVWHLADSSKPYEFKTAHNRLYPLERGKVSFVTERSTGSSDEFATSRVSITLSDLDQKKGIPPGVVFGQVTEGFETLDKINLAIVDSDYRSLQDIRIHHTFILDDPYDDIEGLVIPSSTPEPSSEQLSTIILDDNEQIDLDEEQEITEEERKLNKQRQAESQALTLEIIGDLPSAEVKPMENVLFVCKLNRQTRDEDLETIFSRFGKIISCEIIKDKSTGESLQYAFIEFEEKNSCEAAYFKMDDALIDDRRIHVDFSQSVSKLADAWRNETNARRLWDQGPQYRGGDKSHFKGGNRRERSQYREETGGPGPGSGSDRRHDKDRDRDRHRHEKSYRDRDYRSDRGGYRQSRGYR
jgi:peptidyl-prolyl cis-trans isomerase-like 4